MGVPRRGAGHGSARRHAPRPSGPLGPGPGRGGLPYIVGVGECAQRAALVWRQRLSLEVEVVAAFGNLARAQALIRAELAKPDWQLVVPPREGDAVVMWKGERLAHVGVWVDPGHVLHCTRARGMTLDSVESLPRDGFRVFGCFRRRARPPASVPQAELALAA